MAANDLSGTLPLDRGLHRCLDHHCKLGRRKRRRGCSDEVVERVVLVVAWLLCDAPVYEAGFLKPAGLVKRGQVGGMGRLCRSIAA